MQSWNLSLYSEQEKADSFISSSALINLRMVQKPVEMMRKITEESVNHNFFQTVYSCAGTSAIEHVTTCYSLVW